MGSSFVLSDEELLNRIGAGDQKAFDLLFERYRDKLFSYLFKIFKSRENAEEVVLDVFLKIWSAGPVLLEIARFEPFLFRVAYNRAIDFLRKAQRDKELKREIFERMTREDISALLVDHHILARDTEKAISDAINDLSPQRQEVFRLSREEFLTYDEIAQRMQLSPLTVRNHMSAALRIIRDKLNDGPGIVAILMLMSKNY